ncbi:MAG: hypothetical protein M0R30_06715 [Methanoregula sp.]|uniref:hypothetical protein n=1 Tax=Methanoregula sp. TaxID=2052170 RepID=UPI0025F13A3D|nr:hypothetical protein [Methanoregula sp.]MCK9631319.1 hypothetical protein [Methanoregula sp.]
MTTDLTNPKWTYTIILDDVENPREPVGGKTLDLSGFELSYQSSVEEIIKVTLEGNAPSVDTTTEKIVLSVKEIDSNGNTVASSAVEKKALVVNTGDVTKVVSEKNTNLQSLQSHIDEKSAMGIDTSAAESYYNDAQSKISTASSRPATQYTEALNDLTASQASIDAGEVALELAWAESEVANARIPISNVDGIIAWFKGNQSTANDAQLSAIIAKREVAVNYISNAEDAINSGSYEQARTKAADAFSKGNESYTEALARQKQLTSGWQLPGLPSLPKLPGGIFLIIGVIVVVLVVVGVIIYRKRSRWDELG